MDQGSSAFTSKAHSIMKERRRLSGFFRMLLITLPIAAVSLTSVASTVTYTYDVHGRVASVTRDGVVSATYAYDAAGNRTSTSAPLQATTSHGSWDWYKAGSNPPSIQAPVVVTASGGASGYTYAWQRVSGDTVAVATAPTSSSTKWSRSSTALGQDHISVWRCLVTDSASGTTYSNNVTVTFRRDTNN